MATVVLDDRTADRSLVMTSSFTNMVLAGRLLASTRDAAGYRARVSTLARQAADLLLRQADALARIARSEYRTAVYLGSGNRYGAAREAALKMLEMTDGEVPTFAESFLGLRHGPMCALRETSLLVGFLSAREPHRSYERDLLNELEDKDVLPRTLLVGPEGDVDFDPGDDDAPLLDVVVGQLLGLFRSLALGLRPDAPSAKGVISRVVRPFEIH
jgi:tagatose-6-phosphate ketose/aldose isomerase